MAKWGLTIHGALVCSCMRTMENHFLSTTLNQRAHHYQRMDNETVAEIYGIDARAAGSKYYWLGEVIFKNFCS